MIKNNDGTWTLTDEQMSKFIIHLAAAYRQFRYEDLPISADEAYDTQKEIYDKLEAAGYYNHN